MDNLTFAWDISACEAMAFATGDIYAHVKLSGAGAFTAQVGAWEYTCATRDGAIRYADSVLKRAFAWAWAEADLATGAWRQASPPAVVAKPKAPRKAKAKPAAQAPAQVAACKPTRGIAICR